MGFEHDGPVRPGPLPLADRNAAKDFRPRRNPDSPNFGRDITLNGMDDLTVGQVRKLTHIIRRNITVSNT